MQEERKELIRELLKDPDKLRQKRPFTRGAERNKSLSVSGKIPVGGKVVMGLPTYDRYVVAQERFLRELDPNCHNVLFDENIPAICVKVADNDYREVDFVRMAIPIQKLIKNKQVMHLAANPMQFTLMNTSPTEEQQKNFIEIKQYWGLRNQDGMKYKMVDAQKSVGDAGLLYYFDYKGRIKSRLLSFEDGYVLCSHNDKNGDRVLESVYYTKDDVEYIDSYDDTFMYRMTNDGIYDEDGSNGWRTHEPIRHGFEEIPLITKRGNVAWNDVQPIIECYEELYNVFNAIQKRFGWGILYVKGRFSDTAKKIAGSVILNDNSMDGNGDAKFLTPPTPQGTIDTLDLMLESIQLGSSTTFTLPKDIKMSGDVSGIAVQLTQAMDMETALREVVEWQNVADKMLRLFKYGLAKELVNYGINDRAITSYEELNISAKFKVWQPRNEYEYNQMLTILTGAGILSKESGIELNTVSKPDEKSRVQKENEENELKAQKTLEAKSTLTPSTNVKTNNKEDE
jgi:hypothetical protein